MACQAIGSNFRIIHRRVGLYQRQNKSGYPSGYPPPLCTQERVPFIRRNDLHFVMLKPDRLLNVRSFQLHTIETKRLVSFRIGNKIYYSDRPSQSSERAITGHTYSTACR